MTAKLQIAVVKAFLLTLADGTQKKFEEGIHEVEESIASHWYVKAHSKAVETETAPPPPPPPAGSDEPPPAIPSAPSDAEPSQAEPPALVDEAPTTEADTPAKKKK